MSSFSFVTPVVRLYRSLSRAAFSISNSSLVTLVLVAHSSCYISHSVGSLLVTCCSCASGSQMLLHLRLAVLVACHLLSLWLARSVTGERRPASVSHGDMASARLTHVFVVLRWSVHLFIHTGALNIETFSGHFPLLPWSDKTRSTQWRTIWRRLWDYVCDVICDVS